MLQRSALRAALVASGLIWLVGSVAAAVRLLPWVLDPRVPLHVALPFARGLLALSLEAAVLVGWPVGWAFASFRLVERGEALAIQALGERPAITVARLWPQAALFTALIATASIVGGRDASEPGRVVTELIEEGRRACATASEPRSYVVPFAGATWLCRPDAAPRLVGAAPGALAGVFFSARGARLAGDLRRIELDDARLGVPGAQLITLSIGALTIRGLPPWAQASALPPSLRALFLSLAGMLGASLASLAFLRAPGSDSGTSVLGRRLWPIALGAAGPLAALSVLRLLERTEATAATYAAVPLAAAAAVLAAALVWNRLPGRGRAATK